MKGLPSCSSTSWIVQMLGCCSDEAARGLPLQALEGLRVACQLLGQELERHAAAELEILGLVDDAHAAAAEPGEDPVVRDRLADHGFAESLCSRNSFCFRIASVRIAENSGVFRIASKDGFWSIEGYVM